MRAVAVVIVLAFLAGCAQAPAPDLVAPAAPTWLDVRAAPDGYAGSEVSLAIDPADPLHVVAVAHAGGFGVYESYDGGATWNAQRLTAAMLFPLGPAPVGQRLSLSDPSVAFGPDSTLHVAGLAYLPDSSVFVASRPAGGDWRVSTVWQSEVAGTFNDKEWLAISPVTGTMLVAWQREPAMDQLRGVEQILGGAGAEADVDIGLIVASRSTDGGASWSLPEQIGSSLHANGTQVAFGDDGTAYLVWVDYEGPHIDFATSQDDGATWSAPRRVSDVDIVGSFAAFSRMHTLPGMAVSPGTMAIVWHDDRHGDADIMLAHSTDGGATWQAQRVPDGTPGDGAVQLYPWVAIDNGTVHVTYYGAQHGTHDFAYRHTAFGPDGWSAPLAVSNATFALFDEGDGAADIGDYTAAAALGGRIYAAWADPREELPFIHVGTLSIPSSP